MKILLFLVLIYFTNCFKYERDFITGVIRVLKNDDKLNIDDKCFGEDYDSHFHKLIQAIKNVSMDDLMNESYKVWIRVVLYCPMEDLSNLIDDYSSVKESGALYDNLQNNFETLVKILKARLDNYGNEGLYEIGRGVGEIANILVYNKLPHTNLKFLS
jgi:hypothetical protein